MEILFTPRMLQVGYASVPHKQNQFIFFQTVILKRARHVTASNAIRHRIAKRLEAWGEGKHVMLVGNTLRLCEE